MNKKFKCTLKAEKIGTDELELQNDSKMTPKSSKKLQENPVSEINPVLEINSATVTSMTTGINQVPTNNHISGINLDTKWSEDKFSQDKFSQDKLSQYQSDDSEKDVSEDMVDLILLKKENDNIINDGVNIISNNLEELGSNACRYCHMTFTRRTNLIRHMNERCKIKKQLDVEKENIFKLLLAKDHIIKEKDEKINKILEQNEILVREILDLKKITIKQQNKSIKQNKSTKNNNINSNNINSNNISNTNTQNNIVMFNFGKEDLNIIDKQLYFDRVVKKSISGVKIPEEILKIIHFNPAYPQLSNIYISDINREKCMIWEDGEWKLSPVDKIPEVIDKVVEYSNELENELREKYFDNKKVNDRLDVVNKYVGMNDSEYVEELKEDAEANKDIIKRCENFQKLTYNTFKTTLYNEGKNIKKK
jgi:hypothetical protein